MTVSKQMRQIRTIEYQKYCFDYNQRFTNESNFSIE